MQRIRAACEDDRNACAENDTRGIGMTEEGQLLRQHIAGFDFGHKENISVARDAGYYAFVIRRLLANRVIQSKRPVERMPSLICPRSTILHNCAASTVASIF
jgi:hypothetical protein